MNNWIHFISDNFYGSYYKCEIEYLKFWAIRSPFFCYSIKIFLLIFDAEANLPDIRSGSGPYLRQSRPLTQGESANMNDTALVRNVRQDYSL